MMFHAVFLTLMTLTVVFSTSQLDNNDIQKLLSVMTKIKCEKYDAKPAFFATLGKIETKLGRNEILKFDIVKTNIGNGYDARSGVFTAPISGTYEFSANFIQHGDSYVELNLIKNNVLIARGHCAKGHGTSASIQAVLMLNKGDRVYVRNPRVSAVVNGDSFSMFSGHLI